MEAASFRGPRPAASGLPNFQLPPANLPRVASDGLSPLASSTANQNTNREPPATGSSGNGYYANNVLGSWPAHGFSSSYAHNKVPTSDPPANATNTRPLYGLQPLTPYLSSSQAAVISTQESSAKPSPSSLPPPPASRKADGAPPTSSYYSYYSPPSAKPLSFSSYPRPPSTAPSLSSNLTTLSSVASPDESREKGTAHGSSGVSAGMALPLGYGLEARPVLSNMHQPAGPLSMVLGGNHFTHHRLALPHSPLYWPLGPVQNDRPFRCDQCPQSFNRNHDLKRHKRIHLTVKPFPCSNCEKSFSRRDALKRHRLVKGCGERPTTPSAKERSLASDPIAAPNSTPSVSATPKGPVLVKEAGSKSWNKLDAPSPARFEEVVPAGDLSASSSRVTVSTRATSVFSPPASNSTILVISDDVRNPQVKRQDVIEIKKETPEPCLADDTSGSKGLPSMSASLQPRSCHPAPTARPRPGGDEANDSLVSQTPGSDISSIVTETFLDERKARIIDRAVLDVTKGIKAMFTQARGGSHPISTPSSKFRALKSSEGSRKTTNSANSNSKKRKLDDRDGCDSDNEDKDTGNSRPKDPAGSREESVGYACPYFKYNPAMYRSARSCPGPGWPDVHRVKDHLYRRHRQPRYRCGRCWQPFKDEAGYLDHQRLPEPCSLRDMEHVEGFDAAQEKSLKSRKRAKGHPKLSETEKWREVYKILFPHVEYDDIPSPFYEYSELTKSKANASPSGNSDSLRECEEYLLREVPPRLRQALCREAERNLSIVEETLRREASSYAKTLIAQVFQEFRSQSSTNAQSGQASTGEEHVQPNNAVGQEDTLVEWDFSNFQVNLDAFVLMGDEDFRSDGDALLENILQPTDEAESGKKPSDSGYGSGSPEIQRRELAEQRGEAGRFEQEGERDEMEGQQISLSPRWRG